MPIIDTLLSLSYLSLVPIVQTLHQQSALTRPGRVGERRQRKIYPGIGLSGDYNPRTRPGVRFRVRKGLLSLCYRGEIKQWSYPGTCEKSPRRGPLKVA
jgi:hypothetical protein